MKLIRVRIHKKRTASQTFFVYPASYNSEILSPIHYENERGDPLAGEEEFDESCICVAPDDFVPGEGMEELTPDAAEVQIESWIDKDKHVKSALKEGKLSAGDVAEMKAKRKAFCRPTSPRES